MPSALELLSRYGRIHVGDVAATTEDAFSAWVFDRAAGLDAIMLAPTASLSPTSTVAPVIIASTSPRHRRRCV
jgi:hypothetical protein